MKEVKTKGVRPCGHHLEDGIVQVCFTLPLACNEQSQRAAIAYAEKMGLKDCRVTWMEAIGSDFTYFIIYGKAEYSLDTIELRSLSGDVKQLARKPSDFDHEFRERLGKRAVLLACACDMECREIEFEALISLKGISGEIGLEGYSSFILRRERGLENTDAIIEAAIKAKADAMVVCEPPSVRGKGERALKELSRKLKKSKDLPEWFVLACWRRDPNHAGESISGYDLSFGHGFQPSHIADQLVTTLVRKGFSAEGSRRAEGSKESPRKKRRLWGLLGRK